MVVVVVVVVLVALAVVVVVIAVAVHLCFKQAQPKMCHSPKVDDGVDILY